MQVLTEFSLWDLEYTHVPNKSSMLRTAELSQTPKWVCDVPLFWSMPQKALVIMYLDFTHAMRDLARLQYHAGPSMT